MKSVVVKKSASSNEAIHARYCATFSQKLMGLMFSKEIQPDQGLLIVENRESRVNTAIHMFFVNYDLAVLWLDKDLVVVDKVLAKKWAPFYMSRKPAQYVLELHSSKFKDFDIGERLIFTDEPIILAES